MKLAHSDSEVPKWILNSDGSDKHQTKAIKIVEVADIYLSHGKWDRQWSNNFLLLILLLYS